MEKHLTTLSQGEQNDRRQYVCFRKYEKIVNQFDEMTEMMDAITKTPKRRRMSNSKRNKSTSAAAASSSASANYTMGGGISNTAAVEGDGSKVALASRAEKCAALEQILTKHLNDLQTDHIREFAQNLDN